MEGATDGVQQIILLKGFCEDRYRSLGECTLARGVLGSRGDVDYSNRAIDPLQFQVKIEAAHAGQADVQQNAFDLTKHAEGQQCLRGGESDTSVSS
jgi:hypothetical protein